jgi:hypothetical protein
MRSVEGKMKEYKAWWLDQLPIILDTRIPKQSCDYKQSGRRDIDRPRRRCEAELRTGRFSMPILLRRHSVDRRRQIIHDAPSRSIMF